MSEAPLEILGQTIVPGTRQCIDIPLAAMVTHANAQMNAYVIAGKKPGPTLFISGAVHGDEINGVEIIRRVLQLKQLQRLCGTLVAIPIVNIHGFLTHSRYLPDGRDLNRCFPGSKKGSLAGRMADTFFTEVVAKCQYGIDFHTGARHRENLPQIRADLSQPETMALATAFGVPAIIDSKIRDGSLREAGGERGIPILLYEAGEALRFDEVSIRAGVRGVINVMQHLGMLSKSKRKEQKKTAIISDNTAWVRAPSSGILRSLTALGAKANKGSTLGVIADPLGETEYPVIAPSDGIVIGRTNLPLAHEGDALYHLAYYDKRVDAVHGQVEAFQERLEPEASMIAPSNSDDSPIM